MEAVACTSLGTESCGQINTNFTLNTIIISEDKILFIIRLFDPNEHVHILCYVKRNIWLSRIVRIKNITEGQSLLKKLSAKNSRQGRLTP